MLGQLWSSGFSLMKAGWRLWPLAHVITYGLVPAEHRCPRIAYRSIVCPVYLGVNHCPSWSVQCWQM